MPFITQGKTNLTYLLIVVILAIIVGGGILSYYYSWIKELDIRLAQLETRLPELKAPEEVPVDETVNWKTYINTKFNYSFKYPEDKTSIIVRVESLPGNENLRQSKTTCCIGVKSESSEIFQVLIGIDAFSTNKIFTGETLEEYKSERITKEPQYTPKKSIFIEKEALIVEAAAGKEIVVISNNILYFIMTITKDTDNQLINQILSTFRFLEDEAAQKQEVEQVHLHNLGNYLAGDAENFSQAFSENYINWGLGPVDMDKEFLEKMFLGERFKQLKDKTPEEAVDLDNKIVLGYSGILESEAYESYEGRHGFHFQEGDVFIYFPSELIPDGFSGVYRKENDIWKIIIAD